jgi:hypothetical protein
MIFSVIGQPDLRLGLQLLIITVTIINKVNKKNIFFIVWLWSLKLIIAKLLSAKVIYPC